MGSSSSPTITVAPVAVRPEMDSKIASVGLRCSASLRVKGSAPYSPNTVQNSEVIRKPSRIRRSWVTLRTGSHISRPEKKVIPMADRKPLMVPSSARNARTSGSSVELLNSISKMPRILKETEILIA